MDEEEFVFSSLCNDTKLMDKYVVGILEIGQFGVLNLVEEKLKNLGMKIFHQSRGFYKNITVDDDLPLFIQLWYIPFITKQGIKRFLLFWYFSGTYADWNVSSKYFKENYPDLEIKDVDNIYSFIAL